MRRPTAIAALLLFCTGAAVAQDDLDTPGCVYNRVIYPEGAELCQNGNLVRCEEGAWSDVGDCPEEAPQQPNTGGGDVDEPEQ